MKKTLVVHLLLSLTLLAAASAETTASEEEAAADHLLRRHVDALGGEQALARITSRRCEGSLERHGRAIPIVTYARTPNLLRVETRFPKPGTLVQGFDGTTAWIQHPLQGLRRLEARETAAVAAGAWLHLASRVTSTYGVRRLVGTETRDGVETAVLQLGREGRALETWRFDAASARLIEIERVDDMGPHGDVPVVVRFEDHRTVDGITLPFVVRTHLPRFETVLRLTEVQHNVPLEDALFSPPTEGIGR